MSLGHGAGIVRDGLVLHLDAANPKSYPGSGVRIDNLVDNGIYVNLYGDEAYGEITNGIVNVSGTYDSTTTGRWLYGYNDSGVIADSINGDFTTFGFIKRTTDKNGEILSYRINSWRLAFVAYDHGLFFQQRETVDPWTINQTYVSVDNSSHEWECYALTKTGTTFKFYKNGVLLGTKTFEITETITGGGFSIGIAWSDDDYISNCMTGSIGPILHYTKVLSEAEIKQNFNALRGRYGI